MSIRATCPGCSKVVKAGDDWAGRTAKCPACSAPIVFVAVPVAAAVGSSADANGFEDVIAEESRVSQIIGAVDGLRRRVMEPLPPNNSHATPPSEVQQVVITRISLTIGNMVGLIIGFWFATILAAVLLGLAWLFILAMFAALP